MPLYVVSTGDEVELFLNGKSLGKGKQSYRYLFTFDNVPYEPGTLEAVANDGSSYKLETAGEPNQLKLTAIGNPNGTKADGADLVLFQVEVFDREGLRCPLDDRMIHFELTGEATWIGGISTSSMSIPVECGVGRVLVRSGNKAGQIRLTARAEGLPPATVQVRSEQGSSSLPPSPSFLRGETPLTPSYVEKARGINIVSATAGCDSQHASRSFDDNELSEWKNDGRLSTAWITYKLEKKTKIDDICIKLTGWRLRSYPIEIYAKGKLIWSGETERSLGYIHLIPTRRVKTDEITIRLKGAGRDQDAFGGIVEVAEPAAGELDLFKVKKSDETNNELRIVEIEFLTQSL